jgi:hypothetical protein
MDRWKESENGWQRGARLEETDTILEKFAKGVAVTVLRMVGSSMAGRPAPRPAAAAPPAEGGGKSSMSRRLRAFFVRRARLEDLERDELGNELAGLMGGGGWTAGATCWTTPAEEARLAMAAILACSEGGMGVATPGKVHNEKKMGGKSDEK